MNFPILCHTHYSVGEAFAHPDKLVAKAVEMGFSAIAIADKHTLSGVPEFLQTVQKFNDKGKQIKPIVGCQFRIYEKYFITLYAKNLVGWKNLIRILGCSFINNDGKPEVGLQNILQFSDNLLCGIGGIDSIHHHSSFTNLFLPSLKEKFGENLFTIIVDNNLVTDAEINDHLPKFANSIKTIPLYYIEAEDQICQQILICGRHQKTFSNYQDIFITEPSAKLFWDSSYNYLHTEYPSVPSWFVNQIESFSIAGKPNIPKYSNNSTELLKQLCRQGWKDRKIQEKYAKQPDIYQVYVDRIKMELEIFCNPNLVLADYMLIIYDVMKFIRDNKKLAGLRGSASACLVSYLIGISDVDPVIPDPTLPYHSGRSLIFERFFNKARAAALPDIDLDLCPSFRPQLKEYLSQKWGQNNVSPYIVTYNRLDGRGVVREVMRVLESATPDVITQISTKMLDKAKIQDDLEDLREKNPEYSTVQFNIDNIPDIAAAAEEYKREFGLAIKMSDTIVSIGKHAAAIVISSTPIRDSFPIMLTDTNEAMVGVEMEFAEMCGAVKYDLLCVTAYEKILRILEMVHSNTLEPIVVESKEDDE